MTKHVLKVWPEYYEPIERGDKTLELRRNDRNYRVGDTLTLMEWEPLTRSYTGRACRRRVTHIVWSGEWLQPGVVAMSIKLIEDET